MSAIQDEGALGSRSGGTVGGGDFVDSGSDGASGRGQHLLNRLSLDDLDFVESFIVSQSQMLLTLREIERQANVGIGYAFSAEHMLAEPCMHGD